MNFVQNLKAGLRRSTGSACWRLCVLSLLVLVAWWAIHRGLWPHEVRAAPPVQQGLMVVRKGAGELTARNEARLSSKSSLKVQTLLVEVGDHVRAGQPLLLLERQELEAQAEAQDAAWGSARLTAQAALATFTRMTAVHQQAMADARRAEQLAALGSGAISDSELDAYQLAQRSSAQDLEASRAQAEAAELAVRQVRHTLEAARVKVAEAIVRAPFDGLITARQCSVGDLLSPGTPCLTIVEPGSVYLKARFDESVLGDVRPGHSVNVRLKSQTDRAIPGKVIRVNRAVDADTREFSVDIALSSTPSDWALGERATVEIITEARTAALTVPVRNVVRRGAAQGVWLARQGRAFWVPVRLGASNDAFVEVLEGLSADSIVLEPAGVAAWMRVQPLLP